METTRNAGSCCGHHGATSAPAHRTAAPAPQGYTPRISHNEIDRLFGDFFGGFFSPWRAFSGMAPRSADNAPDMLIPHMDLSVTDTAYKATVELPGVAQDQVNIEVRDNMLIVEGEKKNETEDKDEKKGYYRMERSYGSFRRVLSLPEDVETDKITATHKDGVLSIEIPRKEPEKPAARKIEVVKGE
ncbi:MAG: Hsp20/alpha crystallin family protein [Bilophila wadsworthia]